MKRILPALFTVCALLASCAEEEVAMFGSLSGLVKNAETGAPISGVRATLTPGGLSILTGTDGTFSFSNLDPADYTVSFAADGYEPVEQRSSVKPGVDATVQVVMIPVKPVLAVSTNVLEFGKENTTLSVDISNSGKGTLEWSVSEDISWLTAVPVSGKITSEKATVVFTVSRDGLENGSHTKSLVIASNGGSQTLVATLEVDVLNLTVTPAELDFGTVESTLQLTLKNTGTGSVRYNVRSDNSWCAPNKTSGTVSSTDYLNVVVSRGDLAAGKYNTTVYISTNGGELTVPVKMEVVERQMPTVTLESVEDITYNSATAKGTLLSVGSEAVTRYGVCYATNDSPTVSDKVLNLGDAKKAQSFQSAMTGLQSETTYYVRAFAENSVGLSYSERTVRFTTTGLPTVPTVETGSVDDITSTTAKARGTVSSLGNVEKVTAYGHVWGLSPSPTVSSNAGKSNKGETLNTLSFESSLTSLKVNTTYYVRAYATNSKGTSYGEDVMFTTEKGDVTLTTSDATEIIHNAATAGGTITSDGGNIISEAGVCYGNTSTLTIEGSHIVADLDGNKFSCRINGLATETNYYIRAYVKTDNGKVFYGNNKQFTTTKEVKLPTLGAVTVTNIKTDGATLSSRTSNNGNSTILENGFCWSEYGTPTVDNEKISCAVSTNFGTTISGLTDGTTYHVRSWARNAMGIAYSDEVTFKTVAITAPELSVPQILNVNMEWATAKATVLSTGNTKLDDAGFCISTSHEPTVYDEKYSLGKETELNVKFENLQKGTTYFIRAYAENIAGIGYSTEVSFTTTESDPTVWDGKTVATSFAGGIGSSSDPIRIATAAQLKLFANNVNSGNTYENVYFILTSDIDIANNEWVPIGSSTSNSFKGSFDGNGHVVSNVYLGSTYRFFSWKSGSESYATVYTVSGAAFFGNFQGMVKNLVVTGHNYSAGASGGGLYSPDGTSVAGIAAYASGNIVNCLNLMTIDHWMGCGIHGYQDYNNNRYWTRRVFISNCVNYAEASYGISATTSTTGVGPSIIHSFWVHDVSSNFGTEESGAYLYSGSTYKNMSSSYSFTRSSTQCLISPSYTTDLVQVLNSWVDKNNDDEYGHLCKWTYEYIDGYARPKLIPED